MQDNIIKKLDENIIKLISAGEVIESPCSVVKELVENSIDSGATSIVVEIKNGGKDYIRVTDNGIGIDEQYVLEAFKKHTTSKITTFDDFINITTNGFRGEALASISAVAKICMTTKTSYSNYGMNVVISSDKLLEKTKVGAKDGTTVIVEDLFNDIPARKKFLKTDRAESSKISDFLIRYALANPSIKLKYINNSKQVFQTYGTGKIEDVINIIFAEDYYSGMISLEEPLSEYISVKGVIGNNSLMFSSRKMQYIFINGRIIKDKTITSHIENAYRKYIPSSNFPMFFINIIIKPDMVDVNIHPNKLEVKFADEKTVYNLIENKILSILDNLSMIPDIKISKDDEISKNSEIFSNIISGYENLKNKKNNSSRKDDKEFTQQSIEIIKKQERDYTFVYELKQQDKTKDISINHEQEKTEGSKYNTYEHNHSITMVAETNDEDDCETKNGCKEEFQGTYDNKASDKKKNEDEISNVNILDEKPVLSMPKDIFKNDVNIDLSDNKIRCVDLTLLKYSGRVFDTYIILFDGEDMYMIDQHAAHERVLYERYLKDFYSNSIIIQQLILPQQIGIPVNLVDESVHIIEELEKFGFECDLFGDNIMLLRGIPIHFDENGARKFVNAVFDVYLEENLSNDIIKDKIATKACKAAIKGNDSTIKDIEVEKLIYDLEHCENKYACPHGRPTITRLSKYEIEKFFKRIL